MNDDMERGGAAKGNENSDNSSASKGEGSHASGGATGKRATGGKPTDGRRTAGRASANRVAPTRRYGKPANAGASIARDSGNTHNNSTSRPAPARRYGKPANAAGASIASDSDNTHNNSTPRPAPARRYGKPANAAGASIASDSDNTHNNTPRHAPARRYGKPANAAGASIASDSDNTHNNSTPRPAPARRYGKPATAASGDSRDNRNTHDTRDSGSARDLRSPRPAPARRYGKPATAASGDSRDNRNTHDIRDNGSARDLRSPRPAPSPRRPSPYTRAPQAPRPALFVNARRLALDVLRDVHMNGAFASLSLNEHLRGKTLSDEDKRLVTNIVYGTLENELQIDYALDKLMDHPTREPSQRDLLRMSAYQILFLERVPDSAAVNEAVKLCKLMDMEAASGFINAVLRNLVRGKEDFDWPKREDDLRAYISIMGSVPMWIVDRFIADFGAEQAESMLMYRETAHPVVVRPNLTRMDDAKFEELLTQKGLRFERGLAPHAFLVYGAQELNFDADFRSGLFSIQGQSSILAAEAVQAKPGMRILDACAAPGGKSAYMCEQMQLTGRVYAWELHEKRALLLEAVKRRLKLENLRISVRDATEPRQDLFGTLDAVLLDAPCSGLGVIAQKPDIKLRITEDDVAEIVKTQAKLLDMVSRYVKPGGTLVYSTCSVLLDEDERQVERFLAEHGEFRVEPLPLTYPERLRQLQTGMGLKLMGYRDGAEGFYIVKLKRTR